MENNEFKIDPSLLLDGTEKGGDTIWTINGGSEKIIDIEKSDTYCIKTEDTDYTNKGFRFDDDKYPSAFKRNPFVSQYPKLMEVSRDVDFLAYGEMKVLFKHRDMYWVEQSIDGVMMKVRGYEFASEIQHKAPEFSEVQIKYLKEKFNVNV